MRRRGLNIFPYTSLCQMEAPPSGPFVGGFYFYAQNLETMSQGWCMSIVKYQSIRNASIWEENLLKFTKFYPLLGPNRCQLSAKLNPHSLKMFPSKFGWNQFSGFREVVSSKSLRTSDRRTDDRREVITIAHPKAFGSSELKRLSLLTITVIFWPFLEI